MNETRDWKSHECRTLRPRGLRDEALHVLERTYSDIYRRGSGPAVIIIHEVPGITPDVAAFARRVADCGMTVVLPDLLGTPGRPMTVP
jgi:hypothetical protein